MSYYGDGLYGPRFGYGGYGRYGCGRYGGYGCGRYGYGLGYGYGDGLYGSRYGYGGLGYGALDTLYRDFY